MIYKYDTFLCFVLTRNIDIIRGNNYGYFKKNFLFLLSTKYHLFEIFNHYLYNC